MADLPHEASACALVARSRRETLAAEGMCINSRRHGPATHGVLCKWCREVHKRGVVAVVADPAMRKFRPPGYRFKREPRRFPQETDGANTSGTALSTVLPDHRGDHQDAQRVLARLLDGLDDRILTLSSQVFNYEHKYRWN